MPLNPNDRTFTCDCGHSFDITAFDKEFGNIKPERFCIIEAANNLIKGDITPVVQAYVIKMLIGSVAIQEMVNDAMVASMPVQGRTDN